MSVIAEFSISAADFVLGKALQNAPHLEVELDKMIPVDAGAIPYFWVSGDDRSEFEATLEREPDLESFAAVDELEDRTLYRAEWDRSVDSFVQTLVQSDVVMQEASGDAETWVFQLRFPDSHELSEFHTACRETGVDIVVERMYNPIEPSVMGTRDLTADQRSLMELAYDEGYFDVPRQVTLAELGDQLDVSGQAVNERLRRGLSSLVETTIKTESSRER